MEKRANLVLETSKILETAEIVLETASSSKIILETAQHRLGNRKIVCASRVPPTQMVMVGAAL